MRHVGTWFLLALIVPWGCSNPLSVDIVPSSNDISADDASTPGATSTNPEDSLAEPSSDGPVVSGSQTGPTPTPAAGSETRPSGVAKPESTAEGKLGNGFNIPLTLVLPDNASGPVPVSVGVPVPASRSTAEDFRVTGPAGPVPTQAREMVRLGSKNQLRWLLVDFQAEPGASYVLEEGSSPAPGPAVTVSPSERGGQTVDTGAGRWEIIPETGLLGAVHDATGALRVQGASWQDTGAPAKIEVVDRGPLRALLRVTAANAVAGMDLVARSEFFAGLPYARVRLTLVNHNDAVFGTDAKGADNGECSVEENQPIANALTSPNRIVVGDITWALKAADPFEGEEVLYQDSSGTNVWNYYVGHGPRMQSGVSRKGYVRTVNGVEAETGDVASGTLERGGVRIDLPWFRELFPKALRARNGRLEVGLFPGEYSLDHVFRAGEQKTHEVFVGLQPDVSPPWPIYAAPSFEYLSATRVFGYIGPKVRGAFQEYEEYLDAQLDDTLYDREECVHNLPEDGCPTSLSDAQRRWDFFGWTDYGDVPTDFEFPTSPYNEKYDMNLGFLFQALRSGNRGWWSWAHSSNLHFADIDIFHSRLRGHAVTRNWWQGGAFGHSYHDEKGLSNPHRNCCNPTVDLAYGMAGMAAWALLTGDEMVREAALEYADNILWRMRNSRDSECSALAWGGGTGEGWAIADPPSRSAANAQRIFVWAYRLSGDLEYLDAAGDTAAWYECERDRKAIALGPCASWQEALLARSMAEYILSARAADVALHPQAEGAMAHLLESLRDNLGWDGAERAWFQTCENYANTGTKGNEINAWMFLGADVFSLGYAVTGNRIWFDKYASACFTTAARDPWYAGDTSQYHSSKEVANTVPNGMAYLYFAHGGRP